MANHSDKLIQEFQGRITMKDRGRFFSQQAGGLVYHDSKHKVYKVRMEGAFISECCETRKTPIAAPSKQRTPT